MRQVTWLHADYALWAVLAITWLAAAPFARKTVRREPRASRLKYLAPAVVAGVLMSPALHVALLDARFVPDAAWVGALSVALTAAGIGFALWARATLGRNWSGTVTVKEGHELVQRGPYALARHPIYTGALVAVAGTIIAVGTVRAALCVVVVVVALRFKMAVEERFMTEEFGAKYEEYRRRVKGLVPFVW